MPGLIRGVARTAVVAGTATAVSNRVSRRQAAKWSSQDSAQYQEAPAQYAAPPAGDGEDKLDKLKQLTELRDAGALTPEEFEREKQKILNG
jgi:hypothetical protein